MGGAKGRVETAGLARSFESSVDSTVGVAAIAAEGVHLGGSTDLERCFPVVSSGVTW